MHFLLVFFLVLFSNNFLGESGLCTAKTSHSPSSWLKKNHCPIHHHSLFLLVLVLLPSFPPITLIFYSRGFERKGERGKKDKDSFYLPIFVSFSFFKKKRDEWEIRGWMETCLTFLALPTAQYRTCLSWAIFWFPAPPRKSEIRIKQSFFYSAHLSPRKFKKEGHKN